MLGISEAIKPLQLVGQVAEFKFESKFEPLQVIWQSLPKAVPEDNRRFRGQNQWPSSWGRAPARLAHVGRASTNTGRFRVGDSRCGQRPARLRKTCYHSCDTDSVQELTRFCCFVNFGRDESLFCFNVKRKFRWNRRENVADQSSAHCFPQSFYQSLVSEQTT